MATGSCRSKDLHGGSGGRGGGNTGGGGDTGGSLPGTGGDVGNMVWDGGTGGAATGGVAGGSGGIAGGSGGVATGSGGVAGGSGGTSACPPPPAAFGCAATYDQQVAVGGCTSSGGIPNIYGRCGPNWGWRCSTLYSLDCIYDAQKNLIAAQHCDDVPRGRFAGCVDNVGINENCVQSSGFTTDAGLLCDTAHLSDGGT